MRPKADLRQLLAPTRPPLDHPVENLEHLAKPALRLRSLHSLTPCERIGCKPQGLRNLGFRGPQRLRNLGWREQAIIDVSVELHQNHTFHNSF